MAIYHYSAKIVSRGAGQSVVASLAYINKERERDERLQKEYDYSRQADEVKARGMAYPDERLRERYRTSNEYWNGVEDRETGDKAQLAQRLDVAVPRELTRKQQIALLDDYFGRLARDEHRVSTWALHDKDGSNPHADALVDIREWDAERQRWSGKSRVVYELDEHGNRVEADKSKRGKGKHKYKQHSVSINGKQYLQRCRRLWEDCCNEHLARAGLDARVDRRTLSAQMQDHLDVARYAEQRGDTATMRLHATAAIELDHEPQRKEYNPQSLNAQHNEQQKAIDAKRQDESRKALDKAIKAIKRKKHDELFRARAERTRKTQRTRRELARRNGIKTTDPRELGRVLMHGRTQLDARRTTRSFLQELASGGKQQRYDIAIYTDPQQLMRDNPSVTPTQLANAVFDRRWPEYERRCKEHGWQITPARKDKLRHKIAQDIRKGKLKDVFVVAKSAKQAANVGAKVAVVSLGITRKMLECIQSVARCIPILGKFSRAAIGAAKSPLDAAHKAAKSLDKATRDNDRQDDRKQPRQRGGQQRQERQGGQQQQRQRDEPQRDERGGGLPASSAEAREEHNNGLDKWSLLSLVARADKEMEDFLAEVFGGGRGRPRGFGE